MAFSNDDSEATVAEIAPHVRLLQMIHWSLVAGVSVFFAFVLARGPAFSDAPESLPLMPLGFAAISVVLSFVLLPTMRQSGLAEFRGKPPIPTEKLLGAFQSAHIVTMALLEGAGFFACYALMGGLGDVPRWFLAVPLALIALMVVRVPRRDAVMEWVKRTREDLAS